MQLRFSCTRAPTADPTYVDTPARISRLITMRMTFMRVTFAAFKWWCVCVCVCSRARKHDAILSGAAVEEEDALSYTMLLHTHTHSSHCWCARSHLIFRRCIGFAWQIESCSRNFISIFFERRAHAHARAGSANQYGASTVMCVRVVTYILMLLSAHRDRERVSILELLWRCGGRGVHAEEEADKPIVVGVAWANETCKLAGAPELSYLFTVKFSVSIGTRAHTSNNELKCWIFMLLFFYIV